MNWQTIFYLIHKFWDIKSCDIANYLDVHRSTVSRLSTGNASRFKHSTSDIYKKIFDFNNPQSLASNQNCTANEILGILTDEIKLNKLDISKDIINTNDYEKIIKNLLNSARKNEPIKQPLHKSHPASQQKHIVNNIQEKQPVLEIYESFEDYAIYEFINTPPEIISPDRIGDMLIFIGHIKYCLDSETNLEQNNVSNFLITLTEYLIFLRDNSSSPSNFPYDYHLADNQTKDFKDSISSTLEKLNKLYLSIKIDYENKQTQIQKELQAKQQTTWNDNTIKNSLENLNLSNP